MCSGWINSKTNLLFTKGNEHVFTDDLDNIVQTSIVLATTAVHRPSDSHWFTVFTFHSFHDSNGDVRVQLAYEHNINKVYFRANTGASWSSWTEH